MIIFNMSFTLGEGSYTQSYRDELRHAVDLGDRPRILHLLSFLELSSSCPICATDLVQCSDLDDVVLSISCFEV